MEAEGFTVDPGEWNKQVRSFGNGRRIQARSAAESTTTQPHNAYGGLLASLGRLDEAGAELDRVRELDPLSLDSSTSLFGAQLMTSRFHDDVRLFVSYGHLNPLAMAFRG
jgi:hypothetical protein